MKKMTPLGWLTALFFVLKLLEIVAWPWVIVLLPMIADLTFTAILFTIETVEAIKEVLSEETLTNEQYEDVMKKLQEKV
jgi:hypothetical protein